MASTGRSEIDIRKGQRCCREIRGIGSDAKIKNIIIGSIAIGKYRSSKSLPPIGKGWRILIKVRENTAALGKRNLTYQCSISIVRCKGRIVVHFKREDGHWPSRAPTSHLRECCGWY